MLKKLINNQCKNYNWYWMEKTKLVLNEKNKNDGECCKNKIDIEWEKQKWYWMQKIKLVLMILHAVKNYNDNEYEKWKCGCKKLKWYWLGKK